MQSSELILLYDGKCPICRWEKRNLTAADRNNRLVFIDIQAPGFDPAPYGKSVKQLMGRLHGIQADGSVLVGLETLISSYRAVGWWWLYIPLSCLPKSLGDTLYEAFAARRYVIGKRFGRWFDGACADGVCRSGDSIGK